tara:strand:+ start:97063 stop:97764 length:702 start_codon:yes stop_codon:yes gene_type:complete
MPAGIVNISNSKGENFNAFLATPDSGQGPGIIVLQEIFGINFVMREICHALAAQGYTAICPDLFWRIQPGIELCDKTEGEWGKAFELYQSFDVDQGIKDAESTMDHLKKHESCTGKVGAVGYCLGGKLSYLMSTRTNVDCSVGYYGVGIENDLKEADNISSPHLQHIAEEDQFVPKENQEKIKGNLQKNSFVTLHSYAGVDHAFARIGGEHYDQEAAELANKRTFEFFKTNLI